jgi:indole-3-glycerol phosphate synthase
VSAATILGRIVARARERVAEARREVPLAQLVASGATPAGRRGFREALRIGEVAVIAEFKRRSPSAGPIRPELDPVDVALQYEAAGAAALSVLTEPEFFGGSLEDLRQARKATQLPALQKDFVVDPYQIWQARLAGADAVLLIVAALSEAELHELLRTAAEAEVAPLVEVHDRSELRRAIDAGASLIGVNNRDLHTMEVRVDTSLELLDEIPKSAVRVTESGIRDGETLGRLLRAGFDAALVGEQLMRAVRPAAALADLIRTAKQAVA